MRNSLPTRFYITVAFCVALAITSAAQTFTNLHSFSGPDGLDPVSVGLVQGTDGNFYGTTDGGGAHNHGTVFKMAPDGTLTTLYSFAGSDGQSPDAGLIQATDGNFYGTTRTGGAHCCGTVYKITPNGTLTTLYSFGGSDGSGLYSQLLQATDGNFYGTTSGGGGAGGGTVFKLTPSGVLTTLYNFCSQGVACPDGQTSLAGLIQASDGNFYGTTSSGGANGYGTVFKLTPAGVFTTLHSFDSANDGLGPHDRLVQASDGNFYGTTYLNGIGGNGTVFKITPTGTLTTLFSFCQNLDCSAGAQPEAGLIQASDGNFYGVTTAGGNGHGVIFRMTPSGAMTPLHSFCPQGNCNDGNVPIGALIQANNGTFYGTTTNGGPHSDGNVFSLTGPQLVPTSAVLTSAPNPSHQGQVVTMTATVHAQNGGTPTGNVSFYSDGVLTGAATLNAGAAALNYSSLALGTHSLVAIYQGGGGFAGSTSNTVQQVVALPASTTTVTSSPNPSVVGDQVTITATVAPAGPPPPTGSVSFTTNGSAISGCTAVVLSSGTAVCTTSALAVGTDAIVAAYSGDANYSPSSGSVTQIVNPVPSPLQFVAITPCRVVDTRNPSGPFGGPAIPGNSARSFPLSEGDNPCSIPPNAAAYSLNVTVIPQGRLGYLTIWPTGEGQPTSSTLNSPDGRTKANAVIIPAGTPSGSVSVFVTNTTNVILDINGYFIPANGSTLEFYPVAPCRVADTRGPNGSLGGPSLVGGQERDFPVRSSSCGLPNTVAAYSLNFTVVPKNNGVVHYLTVWPQGLARPTVSTLNDPTGTNVANAAIVPAGNGGGVATYVTDNTDLVIDVNGYFAAPGAGGLSFYTLTPCRVIDTRQNGQPFQGLLTVEVQNSPCGPPATALAYVFNATVVPPGRLGYLTLWPDPEQQPTVSTLNAADGAITSNMAIVPNGNGKTDAYASNPTQLIMDISGYFAP
jgi:uncharacterized repeat protein (TIGR03803 family)